MDKPTLDSPQPVSSEHHAGGLIAIVLAIVLGVLMGVFYGRQMWLAGGGPTRAAERLAATIEQKQKLAEAAEPAEAQRLLAQIPVIQQKLDETQRLADQNKPGQGLPYALWMLTSFCGDLFLQALKLLVVPLVVCSMICGITSLGDVRKLGRLGGWTIVYYTITTGIAVLIGIVLVQVIQPGVGADDTFAYVDPSAQSNQSASALDTMLAVVRGRPGEPGSGMFPSNLFLAASETNVLALIVFSLIFGGALTTLGERGDVVAKFFDGANEAIMKMVGLVMWIAPVGIFGLVAFEIAKQGGGAAFLEQLQALGKYVLTVVLGLLIHGVVLCGILALLARRNPLRYLLGVTRAMLTALTTSSSSATLPITMECVEENNGVSRRAAGFVLPLGATINMDGTALYEAVAVIFIAQSLEVPLGMGQLLVIFLTATLAAIGAAGIPSAGLVTMVIVLTAVGLPTTGIGLILAIDWLLDRLRTTINVFGDAVGAAVVDARVLRGEG